MVSVRLKNPVVERLNRAAREDRRTRAGFVRKLLEQWAADHEENKKSTTTR